MLKKHFLVGVFVILSTAVVSSASAADKGAGRDSDSDQPSGFLGPSMHLGVGIRMKKAPDLDTYYSTVGGVKFSPFSIQMSRTSYLSFLAPGLQYAGYGVFAPSLSPIIFNHTVGIGFAFDFFPTRNDRAGGPIGMSLNLDIVRVITMVSSMTK